MAGSDGGRSEKTTADTQVVVAHVICVVVVVIVVVVGIGVVMLVVMVVGSIG